MNAPPAVFKKIGRAGFTLIELSIVLIIVGLIIGGVLVGRDLISAAETRAGIAQIESLNIAINTFRGKYNCLPGDCLNAQDYGFTFETSGTGMWGNGDGRIDYHTFDSDGNEYFESALALIHLTQAGFLTGIKGNADGTVLNLKFNAVNTYCGGMANVTITFIGAVGFNNLNAGHYILITGPVGSCMTVLPPARAYAIDNKMDDGLPRTGRVLATGDNDNGSTQVEPVLSNGGSAGSTSPFCFTNGTPNMYNIAETETYQEVGGDGPLCVLGIAASF
jgi:prepilin-type N-terminal cleavage/methylation domain-containing protein